MSARRWSFWRGIRGTPEEPVHGAGLELSEPEQRALLHRLDDPRHLEFPRGFDRRATSAKFERLVDLLDRAFDCRTEVDRTIQDAGCFGIIVVPAGATDSGETLTVMISNFGDLASVSLGAPDSYSAEETATLFDPRDRARIDDALRALGYVIMSDAVIWSDYDGKTEIEGFPRHFSTWWDRFFNYL
jgi:hypothetical protein